jgi:hypothetical protein
VSGYDWTSDLEKGYKKWRNKYVELRDAVIAYIESEPYLEHDNKTPEIEKLLKLTEGKRKENKCPGGYKECNCNGDKHPWMM